MQKKKPNPKTSAYFRLDEKRQHSKPERSTFCSKQQCSVRYQSSSQDYIDIWHFPCIHDNFKHSTWNNQILPRKL